MPPTVRRVVTGHDENGRSVFISDGPAPSVYVPDGNPNVSLTDLWISDSMPASNEGVADPTTAQPFQLLPPSNGTVIRILELPPDAERDFSRNEEYFEGMGGGDNLIKGSKRHPGMHRTDTVDYIVILSGEIWALMDDDEVLLRPGDCLVQRGTNHAWSNRGSEPCRFLAVLVDAAPLQKNGG
jgi:mannose-6-phosphate isomerase-like protein (cupin superfamily)